MNETSTSPGSETGRHASPEKSESRNVTKGYAQAVRPRGESWQSEQKMGLWVSAEIRPRAVQEGGEVT